MKDTEIEQWVRLKQGGDTYNRYKVSSLGRVFNTETGKFASHVLTGKPQYFYVNLVNDKDERKLRRVHNIMGWSFLGDRPNKGDTIDHIDRNKYNNSLDNLRWLGRSGQTYNRDSSPEGNEEIKHMLLQLYPVDTPIHKYLYHHMAFSKETLEDAMYNWANYIKPSIKIKELMFSPSVEISGVWYPNRSYVSKLHGVSLAKVKEGVRKGLPLDEIKSLKYSSSEKYRFVLDGYHMTRQEHCERLYISLPRINEKIKKYNLTFEEAIKIPVQRITKHWVNGVVYNNKDLFEKYKLNPRTCNSYLNYSRIRTIRDTLEHYNIDTSEMEIYPCDGKDVVMYNKPI